MIGSVKELVLFNDTTIEIYPNPVIDIINFKRNDRGLVVKVCNLLSSLQTETILESSQKSLNVSNLGPGLYLLNITNRVVYYGNNQSN